MKICSRCLKKKSLSEFYRSGHRYAKYEARCKKCVEADRKDNWTTYKRKHNLTSAGWGPIGPMQKPIINVRIANCNMKCTQCFFLISAGEAYATYTNDRGTHEHWPTCLPSRSSLAVGDFAVIVR